MGPASQMKSSMTAPSRGGRRQSKRINSVPSPVKKPTEEALTAEQVSRMEEELVKFPNPSVYYKKKIATKFSKEFKLAEAIIMTWLNDNGKKDFSKVKKIASVVPSTSTKVTKVENIKKEAQVEEKPKPAANDEDIQCIDIDSESSDIDDVLLSDTDANDSVSLSEKIPGKKKNDPAPTVVKLKPSAGPASVKKGVTNDVDKLKQSNAEMKSKYDNLSKEYQEKVDIVKNLESQIPRMIQEFKKYVEDMETKHKKAIEEKDNELKKVQNGGSSKSVDNDKRLKNLEAMVKKRELELQASRKELKTLQDNSSSTRDENEKKVQNLENEVKKKEMEIEINKKEFNDFKEKQDSMENRYRKLIKKQEADLDRADKDGQELVSKMKKMKEDYAKKNPQHSKELNEIKDAKKKLKRDLEAKEKELEQKIKENSKVTREFEEYIARLENEKNNVNKKMSKMTEENTEKVKSNEDLKKENQELASKIKTLTKEINEHGKANGKDKSKFENDLKSIQSELKNVKADFVRKEEKLLELSEKRGEKIKLLEKLDLESKKKMIETEAELLAAKSNVKSAESEKSVLVKELEEKKKEAAQSKTVILECRAQIENTKTLIKSSTKDISERNNAIAELKKKQQILEEGNKERNAELEELRNEVDRKKNMSQKLQEITEKVKEKEYSLLKLRNTVFDKDSLISDKDNEIKRLSSRIHEIQKDFEKKMESRGFEEINSQNNLRHQLLLQQQEMRRVLLLEQDVLKQQIVDERIQHKEDLDAALKASEEIHNVQTAELIGKINSKKALLSKVKRSLLYKPSAGQGQEKSTSVSGPSLGLGYHWPLVHVSGQPQEVEPMSPVWVSTPTLASLLSIRSPCLTWSLGGLASGRCGTKRKLEEDAETVQIKRLRFDTPVYMLGYSWPVALYQRTVLTLELLVDIEPLSIPVLPSPVQQVAVVTQKRKMDEECHLVQEKRVRLEEPALMISYSWPVAIHHKPKSLTLETDVDLQIPILTYPTAVQPKEASLPMKRKSEATQNGKAKRMCYDDTVLMIEYSWPVAVHQKSTLKVSPQPQLNFEQLPLQILPSFSALQANGCKRILEQSRSKVSSDSKRMKLDPMISYCWPLAVYQKPRSLTVTMDLQVNCTPLQQLPVLAPLQPREPLLVKQTLPMITYEEKTSSKETVPAAAAMMLPSLDSDLKIENEEIPSLKTFSDIPCYSYKLVSPKVDMKCVTSPGLNSSKTVTKRSYKVPKYEETSQPLNRKRSFLDFLEDLSYEEMQEYNYQEDVKVDSVLDLPILVTKPPAKRLKCILPLISLETTTLAPPHRRMSPTLLDEPEFVPHVEMLKGISSYVLDSILVAVVC